MHFYYLRVEKPITTSPTLCWLKEKITCFTNKATNEASHSHSLKFRLVTVVFNLGPPEGKLTLLSISSNERRN